MVTLRADKCRDHGPHATMTRDTYRNAPPGLVRARKGTGERGEGGEEGLGTGGLLPPRRSRIGSGRECQLLQQPRRRLRPSQLLQRPREQKQLMATTLLALREPGTPGSLLLAAELARGLVHSSPQPLFDTGQSISEPGPVNLDAWGIPARFLAGGG